MEYQKQFVERWKEYKKWMVMYDNNGDVDSMPTGFPVPQGHQFCLILITHDESTFYLNDHRKTTWTHLSQKATLQKKGEGLSLMISDMLTSEWGWLIHDKE